MSGIRIESPEKKIICTAGIIFACCVGIHHFLQLFNQTKTMKLLQFKTNLNCNNCVARVTPVLNEKAGLGNWSVNVDDPNKLLTVKSQDLSAEDIQISIRKTGFLAELLTTA
jgi:copper chaperone